MGFVTKICLIFVRSTDTTLGSHVSFVPKRDIAAKREFKDENTWTSLIPPKNLPDPTLRAISSSLDSKYLLVSKHAYYDKSNNLAMYVLRLEPKEGGRRPSYLLVMVSHNGNSDFPKWNIKRYQFDGKARLYNHLKLQKSPEKTVLIVEGEKSADAGAKLFSGEVITVSWLGGSGGVKNTDWSVLNGRNVVVWPDNDIAGFKAAGELCVSLRKVGVGSLKVVGEKMLQEFPKKWDIADPLPQGKDNDYLKNCILRAEEKAVGLDKLSPLLTILGKDGSDRIQLERLNEILWRVEERLRPGLEKEFGSKTWEIEKEILKEVSHILKKEPSIEEIGKNVLGHTEMRSALSYQGLLYFAKTGQIPTQERLSEFKESMAEVYKVVGEKVTFDESSS